MKLDDKHSSKLVNFTSISSQIGAVLKFLDQKSITIVFVGVSNENKSWIQGESLI